QSREKTEEVQHVIESEEAQANVILTRFLQQKFGECFRIVCFTASNDFVPMWAHYASDHAGFAVEFDPGHALFKHADFEEVTYSSDRPKIQWTATQPMEVCKSAFTK